MNRYEGMFLVDNTTVSNDWENLINHIQDILTKHGAEILDTEKWGERKLAYKIGDHSRGTHILVRFNAPGLSIVKIRKEYELSDKIIRTLIVRDGKHKRQPTISEGGESQSSSEDSLATETAGEEQSDTVLINQDNHVDESIDKSNKKSQIKSFERDCHVKLQ